MPFLAACFAHFPNICLINETPSIGSIDTADYETRSCYLLALFTNQQLPLDAAYRAANNLEAITQRSYSMVELDRFFPLVLNFAPAAVYYLAAMLVIDENAELSNRFFAQYLSEIELIRRSFPSRIEITKDQYGLLK